MIPPTEPAAIVVLRRLVTDGEPMQVVRYPDFGLEWQGFERNYLSVEMDTLRLLIREKYIYRARVTRIGVAEYAATVAGAEALATWEKEHEEGN